MEIRATKAEINKLKSDMAIRTIRRFTEASEGYIYSEILGKMDNAVELLVARYGEPKKEEREI